CSSYAGSKVLF
nr:immunoglobulin light chain junction region [Macaca mulatta]MPO04724.1 immunoglobulin light chain junction region [Macaca mulatta]MPO05164.1 immunoglobulin light chain junction region [Macaca mulatta]MPO07220.1 immunoglobulin light chain junction region [Macaca mulatta]MPO07842.1 immunoglobulin light chain junction region [Macaca mulatta]